MNKNLEIQKIKVNSFAEVFAEMRKLKNSGGEWKLLEMYREWTLGGGRKTKDSSMRFILSNGGKKADIVLEKNDYELIELEDGIFGGKEHFKKLREIFPDNEVPFSSRKSGTVGYSYSLKRIGEIGKEHTTIMRTLNAWSLNDIFKILADYYQENKAEIDQSTEKNLNQLDKNEFALSAPWLEVGEDDNLFYIWVGKRDLEKGSYLGGGELEIILKKSDLATKYDENGMKLRDFARPDGAKKLKNVLNSFWVSLTDEYDGKFGNGAEIAHYNANVQVGFNGDNTVAWLNSKSYEDYKPTKNPNFDSPKSVGSPVNSNSSLDQEKEQVSRYMEQNGISCLTLDNGKLIVEYNNSSEKEEKEISSLAKNIQDYLKKHNNSVDLEQLKSNSKPATNQDKKPDYTLWIVGGIVVILALGIFAYWMKKRKNK